LGGNDVDDTRLRRQHWIYDRSSSVPVCPWLRFHQLWRCQWLEACSRLCWKHHSRRGFDCQPEITQPRSYCRFGRKPRPVVGGILLFFRGSRIPATPFLLGRQFNSSNTSKDLNILIFSNSPLRRNFRRGRIWLPAARGKSLQTKGLLFFNHFAGYKKEHSACFHARFQLWIPRDSDQGQLLKVRLNNGQ